MSELTLEQRIEKIKKDLTPEFLHTLTELVKIVGWEADLYETHVFLNKVYEMADKPTTRTIDIYE